MKPYLPLNIAKMLRELSAVQQGYDCFNACVLLELMIPIYRTVTVGPTNLGSAFPVAKQTMTTTNTKDVELSVAQVSYEVSFATLCRRVTILDRLLELRKKVQIWSG